jgi:hypothetical protein
MPRSSRHVPYYAVSIVVNGPRAGCFLSARNCASLVGILAAGSRKCGKPPQACPVPWHINCQPGCVAPSIEEARMTLPTEPLRFDASFETPEPDEAATIQELGATLMKISNKTYEDSGRALRSVHAKSHGIINGELTVLPGLPETLAQGMFAKPGVYPVVMRLSTTPGDILDDNVSTPRGLALKVIGVDGPRLPGSEGEASQDFVFVNGPAFNSPNIKGFLRSLKLLAATTDQSEGLKKGLSAALRGVETLIEKAGGKSPTLVALGGHPETHILGETFYSQVPMLYGPYVVKVMVAPISTGLVAQRPARGGV